VIVIRELQQRISVLILMSVVFDLKSNRGDEVTCDFGPKRQRISTSQYSLERSIAGMAGQSGLSGLDQLLLPVAHGVVRRKSGLGAIVNDAETFQFAHRLRFVYFKSL